MSDSKVYVGMSIRLVFIIVITSLVDLSTHVLISTFIQRGQASLSEVYLT